MVQIGRQGGARGKDPAATREPANGSPNRQKGLWNFLTWSFILSQLLASQQAFAAAANALGAAEDGSRTSDADQGTAQVASLPPTGLVSGTDLGSTVATAPGEGWTTLPLAAQALPRDDAHTQPGDFSHGGTPSPALHTASVQMGDRTIAAGEHGEPNGGLSPGAVVLPPVAGGIGPIVNGVVDVVNPVLDVLNPVGQIVGEVVQAVDPLVNAVLNPVGQIVGEVVQAVDPLVNAVLNPVAQLSADVLGTVTPALDSVLAPVSQLSGGLVQAVTPAVDAVIAPVVQVSSDLIGAITPVADAVVTPIVNAILPAVDSNPVLDAVTPVVQSIEPVVEAVADAASSSVGDALSALTPGGNDGVLGSMLGVEVSGEQPIVVASGSLDFPEASLAAAADGDALFSAGSYTDYSITLTSQTSNGTDETSVTGPSVASTLLDQVIGSTLDVADVPLVPAVTVPSIFQPLGGLGLHDGFHL